MESMEDDAWVADYFSVVGARNDGDLELLDPELHSPEMLKCVWEDAITDIVVVRTGKGESCPEGYELIDRTPMNHNADLNHGSITSWGLHRAVHLAVRRQHVSKRNDYIAEIQVVYDDSDDLPTGQGWELVEKTVSGKSANLNQGGDHALLALRRAVRNYVDCPAAVCSVCVLLLNKEEHPPPGYRVIQKNLNRGKFGDVVQLGYQVGGALSTCRLPFRSMILDRYPEQDSAMFPFPGEQLPMFVYPKGMFLEQRSGRDTPKSSFFSFVFTNVDGRRTYTACLTFYEPMLPSTARRLTRKLFACPQDSRPNSVGVGQEHATQGRARIGLHGSVSAGGLSNLSQQSGPRSRSGTGSWSALGRGDRAGWPPPLARAGVGSGTPPMPSTSWAKVSASTQAVRYASTHGQSDPLQPSAGDVLSSAAATDPLHRQDSHPPSLRAAYAHVSEGANSVFPADGWRTQGDLGSRESPPREAGASADGERRRGGVEADMSQPINPTTATETENEGAQITPAQSEARPSDASVNELGVPGGNVGADLTDHEYDLMCRSEDRPCIFAPKTICVISRFPIYGVLRRFLRHLYAISLSWSGVPLERYISMFVSCIPMPPPGGCPYHVYLEHLENQDPRRSRLKPLSLQMPPDAWLPLMDIDFTAPFRCLSVQSVLTVFALMLQMDGFCSLPELQEAKILFLSSRAELLTQVMEALRSLLFPMEWQSVYVPQLPYAMVEYLECPGGFMIGMRLSKGELEQGTGGTATIVRDLGLDGVANAVNLDAGEVLLYSGHLVDTMATKAGRDPKAANKRSDGLYHRRPYTRDASAPKRRCSKSLRQALGICPVKRRQAETDGANPHTSNTFVPKDEETATPWLPGVLHDGLAARLGRELFGKAGVRTGAEEDLDQYESAFEFAPAPDRTESFPSDRHGFKHRVHFSQRTQSTDVRGTSGTPASTRHHGDIGTDGSSIEVDTTLIVRDSFLCCMAELLGGICGYLRKSEARRSRHSLRTKPPDELFNMTEFLQGMDQGARPFLQRLTSTQMFWGMVQQWLASSPADSQLLFFEECAVAMKNRRAGAVVPFRDKDTPGACQGDGWTHDDFIPLVEEVRLKRPDLYGINSHELYGSVQGSRSTSLPTPMSGSRGKAWDLNARPAQPVVRQTGGGATPDRSESGETGLCRNCTGPPVIIPGPTVQGLPDQERKASFRYDNGWPTPLNRSLLHTVPDALPPVVLKLQLQARMQSRQLSQSDRRVPSPGTSHAGKPLVVNMNSSDHAADPVREGPMFSSRLPPQEGNREKPGYRGDKRFWRPHGHGKMVYQDGTVYEGEWRQGLHHGQGSMHISDGNRYTGQWKLGKKNGSGTMTYPDGARYEGGWVDDHRHGQGTYSYASGAVYDGGWEEGRMHGTGCYTSGCASRRGQCCGHEPMAYVGGRTYVGEWADGVRNGYGTDTLSNGTIFEGSFKRDKRHGVGTLRSGDGGVVDQLWENGKLVTAPEENPHDLVQREPIK